MFNRFVLGMKNKGILMLVILSISILTSCSKSAIKIPNDVIQKDSMMFIMMDIHIAEAGVKTLNADSVAINNKTYYEFIFKKHHVSEEQFRKSLTFYTDNPELLLEIYSKMTEEMSKKETEVFKLK
jgi:hypothetical protein